MHQRLRASGTVPRRSEINKQYLFKQVAGSAASPLHILLPGSDQYSRKNKEEEEEEAAGLRRRCEPAALPRLGFIAQPSPA